LDSASDLWDAVQVDQRVRSWIETLQTEAGNDDLPQAARRRATAELYEAQEVLLADDTRARHASPERYSELVAEINAAITVGEVELPELRVCASFDGDSFLAQAIDVCVSHNESADALAARDRADAGRQRFARELPVGRSTVDLLLVAASLRLSDILDFDRERTPRILFHYLLHGRQGSLVDRSELEWAKHLAVADWVLEPSAVRYRLRCRSPIVHHAVVTFCGEIEDEIAGTRAALAAVGVSWPFALPERVVADVHAEGYRYLPYAFQLDNERIYELMMGRALYANPLIAIRELLQNSVDACRLRDAHTQMNEPEVTPRTTGRICVRYAPAVEPEPATLTVSDSGTGMDQLAVENWLLRVGRSYYRSAEFAGLRAEFRRSGVDFAPVAEFGIGFMACFMLADQVEVRTAMWRPLRGDTRVRNLRIDGPNRLIRVEEQANDGPRPFSGTEVRLHLNRAVLDTSDDASAPEQVRTYVRSVCKELPYSIDLFLSPTDSTDVETIEPELASPEVPSHLEPAATTLEVRDETTGFTGEIVLIDPCLGQELERTEANAAPVTVREGSDDAPSEVFGAPMRYGAPSTLVRGGFVVGEVPGLPTSYRLSFAGAAKLRLTWETDDSLRYRSPTLSRTGLVDQAALSRAVMASWLQPLLDRTDAGEELCFGLFHGPSLAPLRDWLERYSALSIFKFMWAAWKASLQSGQKAYPESRLEEWLKGKGTPLPLARIRGTIAEGLGQWILPRVCELTVGPQGEFYASAPRLGWSEDLATWFEYPRGAQRWPVIVNFASALTDLSAYEYAGHVWIDKRHERELESWSLDDLGRVSQALKTLLVAREVRRPAVLTKGQFRLLQELRRTVGNLSLGNVYGRRTLDVLLSPWSRAGSR